MKKVVIIVMVIVVSFWAGVFAQNYAEQKAAEAAYEHELAYKVIHAQYPELKVLDSYGDMCQLRTVTVKHYPGGKEVVVQERQLLLTSDAIEQIAKNPQQDVGVTLGMSLTRD